MSETTRVNFHCHSLFSADGGLTPEALVDTLAGAGVRYAALTDHDSLEGLPRFQEAARRRGVAVLTGVELNTVHAGRPLHLLGYGFDPQHPELNATLLSLRQTHGQDLHSIAGTLRRFGRQVEPAASAAPNGTLETGAALALIHRAGGRAFFAHPFHFEADLQALAQTVRDLQALGLDGLEAFYAPFSAAEQAQLYGLARDLGLLVCGGTDLHTANGSPPSAHAVDLPTAAWRQLRAAVSARDDPASSPPSMTPLGGPASPAKTAGRPPRTPIYLPAFRLRFFVGRILLPALLAIALFIVAIWGVILPSYEAGLMDRQREMIRELTNSAWSILASYAADEEAGLLTRAEAQALAIDRIEALRYGREGKDYFWLQDMQPRIIMHPYRPDLNGQDVSGFADPAGARIFVAFADVVRRQGDGYIDYVWQWKDDPQRLEPKESYVKGFAPWGWIIGTGIYIDDVEAEIARMEQRMVNVALAISGVMVLLMLFVVQQSLSIERRRRDVEGSLRDSTERYHALVEAATEGTLLVLDGRCRYANATFLHMVGYATGQLELLELADLLPHAAANQEAWRQIEQRAGEDVGNVGFEGVLQRADGSLLECVLAVNAIEFAGQAGLILLAKDITPHPAGDASPGLAQAVEGATVGVFRARAARRGVLLERNAACVAMMAGLPLTQPEQPALADLFADAADFDEAWQTLHDDGALADLVLHLEMADATTRFLLLSAHLVRDEAGHPLYVDGTLEDVTAAQRREAERAALVERLQSSLLFLHEPVGSLGAEAVQCRLDATIEQAAAQMTAARATAALVVTEANVAVGIVTDNDMRARALAGKLPPGTPVHTIMSAPLAKISEHASIYEALMRMEEKGVKHLAVEADGGRIVGVIDNQALIQFPRYGPIVLARDIARAVDAEAVARCCRRAPALVRALVDSGARPRSITHMLASTCDAASERLLSLAMAELGPAPVPFVWVAMGSQGRQEQTLVTDQDNGILYQPSPPEQAAAVAAYFLRLGERVCAGLDRAGYIYCRGQVMASNPTWCRSLADWKAGFDAWVSRAEGQELMELSIFFDFRPVYGDAELAHELRRHIHATLGGVPAFFPHMAQQSLTFKPPFRLLGSLYFRGGATEQPGQINLKDAMMPMVTFARLYALRHQVGATHTLDRVEALAERKVVQPASRDEMMAAYDFLMQLRLRQQVAAHEAGRPADNLIQPASLGHMERELLKQAFAQIAAVQKKTSYDFLGGM